MNRTPTNHLHGGSAVRSGWYKMLFNKIQSENLTQVLEIPVQLRGKIAWHQGYTNPHLHGGDEDEQLVA